MIDDITFSFGGTIKKGAFILNREYDIERFKEDINELLRQAQDNPGMMKEYKEPYDRGIERGASLVASYILRSAHFED
jgi:hypothetical protein